MDACCNQLSNATFIINTKSKLHSLLFTITRSSLFLLDYLLLAGSLLRQLCDLHLFLPLTFNNLLGFIIPNYECVVLIFPRERAFLKT